MDYDYIKVLPNKRLSDAEIKCLIRRSQQGDLEARNILIENNLRLVASVVKRFQHRGFDSDDLFQIGSIGLMKAIDGFDLSYNVRFSTYAVPKIVGEIKRYIRESSTIRVSRSLKELAQKAIQIQEQLTFDLGRTPTVQEVAEHLGVDREDIVVALDAIKPVHSLHQIIHENDGDPLLLEDQIAATQADPGEDTTIIIKRMMEKLEPEDQKFLMLRYFAEKSQTEVAKILGISQAQVSRIEKRIMLEMRKYY